MFQQHVSEVHFTVIFFVTFLLFVAMKDIPPPPMKGQNQLYAQKIFLLKQNR